MLDADDRQTLDDVLNFIGAESLSDDEFADLELDDLSDELENYNALIAVLLNRDSVSDRADRLFDYYKAKGVEIPEPVVAKSNILVGGEL